MELAATRWKMVLLVVVVTVTIVAAGAGRVSSSTAAPPGSCKSKAEAAPRILEAELRHPGDHYSQTVSLEFTFGALPGECQKELRRTLPHYRFELQDPLHHSLWIPMSVFRPASGSPIEGGKLKGYWYAGIGKKKIGAKHLYQCSPGGSVTEARVSIEANVVESEGGKPVVEKTFTVPVEVKRVAAKSKHRGALRGPC